DSALEQKIRDILRKVHRKKGHINYMVRCQKRKFNADADATKDSAKDSSASNQPKSKPQKPTDEPMVMMAIHPTSSAPATSPSITIPPAVASPPSNLNTDAAYELRDSFILDSGAT